MCALNQVICSSLNWDDRIIFLIWLRTMTCIFQQGVGRLAISVSKNAINNSPSPSLALVGVRCLGCMGSFRSTCTGGGTWATVMYCSSIKCGFACSLRLLMMTKHENGMSLFFLSCSDGAATWSFAIFVHNYGNMASKAVQCFVWKGGRRGEIKGFPFMEWNLLWPIRPS